MTNLMHFCVSLLITPLDGFGGLVVSILATGTRVYFTSPSFGGEVK